jgi:hypothetical protein
MGSNLLDLHAIRKQGILGYDLFSATHFLWQRREGPELSILGAGMQAQITCQLRWIAS